MPKRPQKNQITLPKKIADSFPDIEYFDIWAENDRIILKPLRPDRSDEVRRKLKSLKISEKDIAEAVSWARKTGA